MKDVDIDLDAVEDVLIAQDALSFEGKCPRCMETMWQPIPWLPCFCPDCEDETASPLPPRTPGELL